MRRLAGVVGMTEGQTYTVVIGLVVALTTAFVGIPPALRDQVTRVARATTGPARTQTPAQPQASPAPATGSPVDAFPPTEGFGGTGPSAPISEPASTDLATGAPAAGGGPSALGAGSPTRQGWWTSLSFLNPSLPGIALPVSYPPDVPADGLYVAGGSPSPQAYSALLYQVPQGVGVAKLTLHVAQGSFSSPAAELLACPLKPASMNFSQAQGGDSTKGPQYDCQHGAKGTASLTGDTYSFDVRAFIAGELLGIAIVPSQPADRVVFARPVDGSLSRGS